MQSCTGIFLDFMSASTTYECGSSHRGRFGVGGYRYLRKRVLRDSKYRCAGRRWRAILEFLRCEPGVLSDASKYHDGKTPGANKHNQLDRRRAERRTSAGEVRSPVIAGRRNVRRDVQSRRVLDRLLREVAPGIGRISSGSTGV